MKAVLMLVALGASAFAQSFRVPSKLTIDDHEVRIGAVRPCREAISVVFQAHDATVGGEEVTALIGYVTSHLPTPGFKVCLRITVHDVYPGKRTSDALWERGYVEVSFESLRPGVRTPWKALLRDAHKADAYTKLAKESAIGNPVVTWVDAGPAPPVPPKAK